MALRKLSLLLAATTVSVVAISLAAGCQANKPASTAAVPAIQLQPYTAPDKSASAGVPAGWQVTKGQQTVIQMTGPQGETLILGNTFVARDAPFQPDLSMPYTAALPQKLTMIIQQNAAVSGKPAPQINITSATFIQLPAALGQCGRFVADIDGAQGPMKIMAVFCSLPLDFGGAYKNIVLLAQVPAAQAAQSAPAAQAVFDSYRIPTAWLEKKLAPHNAPPLPPAGAPAMMNRSTVLGEAGADVSADCFDLVVLRETPNYQLPRSCGGTKSD
jgi:hypothetical protein